MLVTVEDCLDEPHPSIKNFVVDLEHTWGNSEKWVLERGGRQISIPLSLYHSPGSMSDFSDLEGAVGLGGCDGALDNGSVVSGSDCDLGDFDGGLVNWENIKEPLVVQPLAMANPVAPLVEVAVASTQLSPWVEKRIKAFRKYVGTSLEGFEAEINGIFLALRLGRKLKCRKNALRRESLRQVLKGVGS